MEYKGIEYELLDENPTYWTYFIPGHSSRRIDPNPLLHHFGGVSWHDGIRMGFVIRVPKPERRGW